jgi:hypothetical protein
MQTGSDGQGGTKLSFAGSLGSIDLKGVAAVPTTALHWS